MKISFLLIIFVFAVSCFSYSSCKNKVSEFKVYSDKNALKTDIPVNKENKFYASSTKNIFPPENVFDYDDKTFWSPENNIIDEWLAVYVGKLETLGIFTECNLVIWDGYNNSEGENIEYSKPTKYKIEFYVDENLILERSISKTKYSGDNGFPGYIESNFDFHNLNYEKGTLWVKATILETEKTGSAAIRDIKFSFKNANPMNAFNEISLFCDAINKQDLKSISNFTDESPDKVLDQFVSEYDPDEGPECSMARFEVNSDDTVSLEDHPTGEGESRVFFKYKNGKWKIYTYAFLNYF